MARWERWEDSEVARLERWEGSEVGSWERWEGSEMARWERWESSEVARWEVLGFIQDGDAGWVPDFIFLFLMLINKTKEQDVFKIFLHGCRDGKTLLRSYGSC